MDIHVAGLWKGAVLVLIYLANCRADSVKYFPVEQQAYEVYEPDDVNALVNKYLNEDLLTDEDNAEENINRNEVKRDFIPEDDQGANTGADTEISTKYESIKKDVTHPSDGDVSQTRSIPYEKRDAGTKGNGDRLSLGVHVAKSKPDGDEGSATDNEQGGYDKAARRETVADISEGYAQATDPEAENGEGADEDSTHPSMEPSKRDNVTVESLADAQSANASVEGSANKKGNVTVANGVEYSEAPASDEATNGEEQSGSGIIGNADSKRMNVEYTLRSTNDQESGSGSVEMLLDDSSNTLGYRNIIQSGEEASRSDDANDESAEEADEDRNEGVVSNANDGTQEAATEEDTVESGLDPASASSAAAVTATSSETEHPSYDSSVTKRTRIPHVSKRQFIQRPRFVVRNGYVYMRAPPMTQKTIVTTHVPRPPIVMPYNSFVNHYMTHGGQPMHVIGHHGHFMPLPMEDAPDPMEYDEREEGHCEGEPCMNGGTCNEVRDGYECVCPTGYKGTDCEEEDKCHPNPCRNNGVCTETNSQYVCTCAEGFKGLNCQEMNHCQPNPCRNGATCIEALSGYECICPSEFIGRDCQEINHCHMTPCLNGGTCSTVNGISMTALVSCVCPGGYNGPRCELHDRCHENPCRNGGLCKIGGCSCINGFSGEFCDVQPSPCSLTPCLNGGTCLVKGLTQYKCICRHGYRGANCEEESHCEPNPCLNSAACFDTDDGFKCECTHGFKGAHCEDEVSPCDTNPCMNEGNCIVSYNKYKCLCKTGFKGMNCEDLDRCHRRPCRNGGVCISDGDEVKCECLTGYKGALCEEMDKCLPNPCLNGGICFANSDSYTCQCAGGFRGLHCTERDPCHPSPCHHDALCIPEGEDFRCQCSTGWLGLTCEDEDRCHPSQCQHGGVCVSHGSSAYECHCPSGYGGINCEVETFPSFDHEHRYDEREPVVVLCRNTHFGCCPDGETPAHGPAGLGCPAFHPY